MLPAQMQTATLFHSMAIVLVLLRPATSQVDSIDVVTDYLPTTPNCIPFGRSAVCPE